jgi:hypothetical protein
MKEIWKDIPGHAGYQASDRGGVRSLARVSNSTSKLGNIYSRKLKGCVLKQRVDHKGYLCVYIGSPRKWFNIHTIVAITFLGDRPLNMVIDHKDRNKKNNYSKNLRYVSHSINHLNTSIKAHRRRDCVSDSWKVSVGFNGRRRTLGSFRSQQEAVDARNALVDSMIAEATAIRKIACARA